MKLGKLFLYVSFIFVIFLSTTNVNASENVKIKSIDLVDKSVNATETSKATFNGLTMNFNIRFLSVDDYAKYKIVVENKENKDYNISVDSEFNNSKYITYEYEKTDSLKANSESEFYVTVTYKNKVSDNDLVNDKYIENDSAVLKLSNDNISNPNTSNNEVMIIIGLIVMVGILLVLFRNKKTRKVSVFVLFGLFSVPLFVKAVDFLKITFNSNVVIEKGYSVGYQVYGYIKASEASNYNLSYADSFETAYEGSVSDENKYILYGNGIYIEEKLYVPGETVKFDYSPAKTYEFDSDDCQTIGVNDSGYDIYICGTPKKVNIYPSYEYTKSAMEDFGYKYNDDDNTVMKFSKVYDEWQDIGRLAIYDGSTFTMPNHDVLFNIVLL